MENGERCSVHWIPRHTQHEAGVGAAENVADDDPSGLFRVVLRARKARAANSFHPPTSKNKRERLDCGIECATNVCGDVGTSFLFLL